MKEDKRVRLMKNRYNRRQLYSRAKLTFKAKRKYIILSDSDDLFIRQDLFTILYEAAKKKTILYY